MKLTSKTGTRKQAAITTLLAYLGLGETLEALAVVLGLARVEWAPERVRAIPEPPDGPRPANDKLEIHLSD